MALADTLLPSSLAAETAPIPYTSSDDSAPLVMLQAHSDKVITAVSVMHTKAIIFS